jgi:hypothetical protein
MREEPSEGILDSHFGLESRCSQRLWFFAHLTFLQTLRVGNEVSIAFYASGHDTTAPDSLS